MKINLSGSKKTPSSKGCPSEDEIKNLSLSDLLTANKTLGLTVPNAKGDKNIQRMMAVRNLLVHYGYADNKRKPGAGRKPSRPTTVAIHENADRHERIERKLDLLLEHFDVDSNEN